MGDGGRDVSDRERRTHPILAAALVGLLVGSIGLIASMALYGTPIGGFTGAISCGITAVYLSPPDVQERLRNVVIADIVSTIVFVVLVLTTYLAYVRSTEGLTMADAALFTYLFVVFGVLGVAVPIGLLSIGLAVLAGIITARIVDQTRD